MIAFMSLFSTTFNYSDLAIEQTTTGSVSAVSCSVTNVGGVAGSEVARECRSTQLNFLFVS